MKKVTGILMVLVMMVLTIGASASEMAYNMSQEEGYDLVREWCKTNFYDHYLSEDVLNDVAYGCGALDVDAFERETGKQWTMETWIDYSKDEWKITYIDVHKVGEVEGYDVFNVYAESTEEIWTKYDQEKREYEKYKKVTIMFMVCTRESKEAREEGLANSRATVYWE